MDNKYMSLREQYSVWPVIWLSPDMHINNMKNSRKNVNSVFREWNRHNTLGT